MSVITGIRTLLKDNAYMKGLLYHAFGDTLFMTNEFNEDGSIFMLTFNHSKSPFPFTVCIDYKGYLEDIQSDEDLTMEMKYKEVCKNVCFYVRRRAKLNHLGFR